MHAFAFERSGALSQPSAAVLEAADADTSIIVLTRGRAADGRPYYAYVAVRPSRYEEFRRASKAKKTVRLGDYGAVIASGFAESPPPSVAEEVRRTHGFDDEFEEKLVAEAKKQQKVFLRREEDARVTDALIKLKRNPQ